MQNSQVISILTIFILVSSVTTIALTLEGSDTVFAAKKSKSEDKTTTGEAASTPSTSESSNTPSPLPPTASNEDTTDGSGKSDVSSGTINPLSLLCPDGSIPVKGKCPPAIISEDTSGTKNKHKSDETTTEASTPSNAVGESNSDAGSTTTPPPSTTPDDSSSSKDSGSKDSSSTPPPSPPTTSDSSSNTSLPSIIPSNHGAGSTDGGSSGGSTKSSTTTSGNKDSSSGGSTDTGDSGNSSSSGSTPPPPTTSGSGSSGSASSSSSSSSSTTTKPSNSNTPQTGVSQSAANAATNQIINSPGSTIVNQQSIKQSVRINNEVNNIIRKNVISQSSSSAAPSSTSSSVISNLITVKLATTTTSTMSRNAYLPIGDVAPYHLIGGHITANLPNNHLYVVVAQLASSNGAIQHAVILDMIKSQISNIFETDLGSQISGTNPLTGKQDVVSDITNLFLWNNGNQQVTFVDANAVTMNLIYR
ncbi:MAG: hypothetical protein ACJ704_15365 [Nitrososphaeraceae archaeon]